MTIDTIAHAYATIGVRPGASASELKQRYKQLVKTWHPDRWANDPVNQAEATERMRMINEAYATLHHLSGSASTKREPPPPVRQPEEPANHWSTSHRPMTKDELDAIVHAIGDESSVGRAFNVIAWLLPMAVALVPIMPHRRSVTTRRDWAISAVLFAIGVAVLVYQQLANGSDKRS